MSSTLHIADKTFSSRLFTGTGKFGSHAVMQDALIASETQLTTVALRRVDVRKENDEMLSYLKHPQWSLLPNTSGVRTAKEAIFAAKLAREALEEGFVVLPYCHADPVLCKRLEEVGCAVVMPLGAPIGSNQGLATKAMLEIIIEQALVPVIIDAGIGAPSHAAEAMEMGADAVLVNTAIAIAGDPVQMATAFKLAVR